LDGAWGNEILSLVRFALADNDANELLTEVTAGGLKRLSLNKTHTSYRQRYTVTVLNWGSAVPGPVV
jgi:hypothetical protein